MNTPPNSTKRNRIIGIEYALLSESSVRDFPGNFIQVMTSSWQDLKITSVEFTETEPSNGDFIEQELAIVINGEDSILDSLLQTMTGNEVLLRLTYSNGEIKIVGTEENPVVLARTKTGSPVQQILSSKRKSAERAKFPIS